MILFQNEPIICSALYALKGNGNTNPKERRAIGFEQQWPAYQLMLAIAIACLGKAFYSEAIEAFAIAGHCCSAIDSPESLFQPTIKSNAIAP